MHEMIQKMCTRRAIRRFQSRQLDESVLEEILTAGLYAPSAGNNQLSRIVVCQDPAVNAELGKISRYMQFKGGDPKKMSHAISAEQPSIQDDHTILNGFYDAPTVLTIFVRPGQYAHDDAAMVAENIWLAAHFLGVPVHRSVVGKFSASFIVCHVVHHLSRGKPAHSFFFFRWSSFQRGRSHIR